MNVGVGTLGTHTLGTARRIIPAAAAGAKNYYLGGNAINRGKRGFGWAAKVMMLPSKWRKNAATPA